MIKKLTNTKSIFLVGAVKNYHIISVVAAFSTEKSAKNFIEECKKIVNADEAYSELKIGHWHIDKYNVDELEILNSDINRSKDFPFFDKQ